MIIDKVIQNIYEIKGNFVGIENHKLFSEITDNKEVGKNLTDFLYESLGYKPIGNFTAKDVHDLRIMYMKGEFTGVEGVSSSEQLYNLLNENGMAPLNREYKTSVKNKKLLNYINVLAKYLKHSKDIISYNGKKYYLSNIIEIIKLDKNHAKKIINTLLEENNGLISFNKIDSVTETIVASDATLYLNVDLTKSQEVKIVKQAIEEAAGLNVLIPKGLQFEEIPYLSAINNLMYLELLDLAEINQKTLSNYMRQFGINIPDYSGYYLEKRVILFTLPGDNATDKLFAIPKDYSKENPYVLLDFDGALN